MSKEERRRIARLLLLVFLLGVLAAFLIPRAAEHHPTKVVDTSIRDGENGESVDGYAGVEDEYLARRIKRRRRRKARLIQRGVAARRVITKKQAQLEPVQEVLEEPEVLQESQGSGSGSDVPGGNFSEFWYEVNNSMSSFGSSQVSAHTGNAEALGSYAENIVSTNSEANASTAYLENTSDGWNLLSLNGLLGEMPGVNLLATATNYTMINIYNYGSGTAQTGNAYAMGAWGGNLFNYNSPVTIFNLSSLGTGSSSNVTVNTIYNVVTNLFGNASANTGNASAYGGMSQTEVNVNSVANALTLGLLGSSECSSNEGSSTVTSTASNSTNVGIENNGEANAQTGNAYAIGVWAQNLINTNLNLIFNMGSLGTGSNSNVAVNVVYNIVANLFGNASANTGNASAYGGMSQTEVDVNSSANACAAGVVGESGTDSGEGSSTITSTASNSTNVGIENNGEANAQTGNAYAIGVWAQNLINTNLNLIFNMGSLGTGSNSNVAVNVVYNIVANLFGNASANTGNASAYGGMSQTEVDVNSVANALALGLLDSSECGEGSSATTSTASNSTEVDVTSNGEASAGSGEAYAIGVWANNLINANHILNILVAALGDDSNSNSSLTFIYNAVVTLFGDAQATTGDALAVGNDSETEVLSGSLAAATSEEEIACEGESGSPEESLEDSTQGSDGEDADSVEDSPDCTVGSPDDTGVDEGDEEVTSEEGSSEGSPDCTVGSPDDTGVDEGDEEVASEEGSSEESLEDNAQGCNEEDTVGVEGAPDSTEGCDDEVGVSEENGSEEESLETEASNDTTSSVDNDGSAEANSGDATAVGVSAQGDEGETETIQCDIEPNSSQEANITSSEESSGSSQSESSDAGGSNGCEETDDATAVGNSTSQTNSSETESGVSSGVEDNSIEAGTGITESEPEASSSGSQQLSSESSSSSCQDSNPETGDEENNGEEESQQSGEEAAVVEDQDEELCEPAQNADDNVDGSGSETDSGVNSDGANEDGNAL